jgi:hypothetical protein
MLAPVLALAMMQKPEASSLYLYNTCQSAIRMMDSTKPDPRDFPGGNYCIGYITGFMDGSGTNKHGACIPDSVGGEKITRTYVAYMRKHPEENPSEKRFTLIFALADAYPCPAK